MRPSTEINFKITKRTIKHMVTSYNAKLVLTNVGLSRRRSQSSGLKLQVASAPASHGHAAALITGTLTKT
jgi:hypothetical protein